MLTNRGRRIDGGHTSNKVASWLHNLVVRGLIFPFGKIKFGCLLYLQNKQKNSQGYDRLTKEEGLMVDALATR